MPPNWVSKFSALTKFGLVLLIACAVYSATQTVAALLRGSLWSALTAGGLTLFFGASIAALAFTILGAGADAGWDEGGTTVRVNSTIVWSWGVALFGAAVGSACYLAFVSAGDTGLPFTSSGRGGAARYLMAALLALSVIGLTAMLRTRESGRLRLGVDGIEHADMFRTRSARWEDIVGVTDRADKRVRNPIVFVVKDDEKPVVVPNADRYGSSGPALYWMARHYWKHPESRDELVNGRALDRLRDGRFDQS